MTILTGKCLEIFAQPFFDVTFYKIKGYIELELIEVDMYTAKVDSYFKQFNIDN